ncbi:efflux RND transporter periplasmic adaptor subunit [Pseudomonas sp. SA3-5]|uniref:Efflux RND transporter periplasmic adaptor subunit n=1 Tax=Pseudomonas aestuarii TaxID=3018340 RepID=A0ABT4XL63_9PSED|nr:efflux RND transporter periplasmic adaptor subunit [Pseudomonas aestuarii]MDA7088972.1 efflux RND transporter periplasmic adaptor subunit [Pseudomonas aestuarii]
MRRNRKFISAQTGICLVAVIATSAPVAASQGVFECLISPYQTVEVRSPTDGLLDKILVKRGDRVEEGQTLVVLESSVEKSAVKIAKYRAQMNGRIQSSKSRLELAKKNLSRIEVLLQKNMISAQIADEADAQMRIAEAELHDALENQELAKYDYLHAVDLLNQRTLRSPLAGVVVDRMLNPGDLAESGTGPRPILKLAQIDPLLVEVALPLEAYGKLQVGMTGTVTPEGGLGSHAASVTIVDSVFDAASGMFGVRLEILNQNGLIPGGVRCQVVFPALQAVAANPQMHERTVQSASP